VLSFTLKGLTTPCRLRSDSAKFVVLRADLSHSRGGVASPCTSLAYPYYNLPAYAFLLQGILYSRNILYEHTLCYNYQSYQSI
jgi:hypothetical protein